MAEQKPVALTILGDPAAAICNDEFCVIPLADVAANVEISPTTVGALPQASR
jgi:hypothetical protein